MSEAGGSEAKDGDLKIRQMRLAGTSAAVLAGLLLTGCVANDAPDGRGPAVGLTTAPGPIQVADVGSSHVRISDPSQLETPYGRYLAGRHAERVHDYRHAAEMFAAALADAPDNEGLRLRTFSVMLRAGMINQALPLAETLYASHPDQSSMVALVLAVKALKEHDYPATLKYLQTPARQGEQFSFPVLKAWAHLGAGEAEAALAALDQLREGDAFPDLAQGHSGLILMNSGDLQGAEAAIPIASDDLESVPAWLIRTLARVKLDAGDVAGATDLLDRYATGNRFSLEHVEADRASLAATGTLAPLMTLPNTGVADGLLRIASGVRPRTVDPSVRQPAHDIALIYAWLSVYLDNDHDEARLLIAGMMRDLERFEESSTVLQEIAAGAPFSWRARIAIADNLIDADQNEAAIALLETMAAERVEDTDALLKIGDILRSSSQFEEGTLIYDRAFERISPDDPGRWRLHYFRGITYERSKRWKEAEADFLAALEINPDNPYVLNYLGYSWIDQGINVERATDMVRQAVDQRQNDGYIVDSLGWAYYRVGKFTDAVVHLERAVQLRPADPVINDHLGDAYWRIGRQREARFQWTRALSLDIEEELIAPIEEKMRDGMGPPEVVGAAKEDG